MRIDVLTLFPDIFSGFLKESLLGKACSKDLLEINIVDIRSFTKDRHRVADDKPFGGGPGMVMKVEPIHDALKSLKALKAPGSRRKDPLVMLLSPQGKVFDQKKAKKLSLRKSLVLICGHYEGVDERVTRFIDEEVSIGDYVLNGGEVPAMVVIETVARLLPGFMKERDSLVEDSFYNGLLDWPAYTRPADFKGLKVPEVLLSGDHKKILEWRKEQSFNSTKTKKPYLLRKKNE